MASWADEISAIIEKNIAGFGGAETSTASVGTVIAVQDGIARVYGLQNVKYLELVEFPRTGIMGMAFNLEEESVACPILGDYTQIREDDEVRTTGRVVSVPVGDALIGRVVNPLGEPLDDRGPVVTSKTRPVERVAPGVITRQSVSTPVLGEHAPRLPEPHTRFTAETPSAEFALAYDSATPGAHAPLAQLLATASAPASAPFCSWARSA